MRLACLMLATALIAGCSGNDPTGPIAETGTATSGSATLLPAPADNGTDAATAIAGSQLGRTNATPIIDLAPGSWSLTFDQQGIHQAVLRLQGKLEGQAYSISGSGSFTLALFPLDTVFGACTASGINAIATGRLVGLNNTIHRDLEAGDYFLILHNEDMGTQFTWQVGDSDEERDLDVAGEATGWKAVDVTASVQGLSFSADVQPGLQFLLAQGSTTGPSQDSSLTHEVVDGSTTCAAGQDDAGLSPFGGTLRVQATLLSGAATTWSGTYAATTVLPTPAPTVSAMGRVLVPPGV